jgi:hypothetical protein
MLPNKLPSTAASKSSLLIPVLIASPRHCNAKRRACSSRLERATRVMCRRAAQARISRHQSKREAACNRRRRRQGVRFERHPVLYLAEKTGKFLPAKTDKARGELWSWMFFVSSGVGPYFGQSVHFRVYAPEKISYATNRYVFEAQRHAGILDARLAKQKYMLGDTYTIVDMNVWGWARLIPTVLGDGAWEKFPNLKRQTASGAAPLLAGVCTTREHVIALELG